MAEFVENNIQDMVLEFEYLKHIKLFSSDEIK